jgi:hypothetical protein
MFFWSVVFFSALLIFSLSNRVRIVSGPERRIQPETDDIQLVAKHLDAVDALTVSRNDRATACVMNFRNIRAIETGDRRGGRDSAPVARPIQRKDGVPNCAYHSVGILRFAACATGSCTMRCAAAA